MTIRSTLLSFAAVVVSATLVGVGAAASAADHVDVDGDALTPITESSVSLGAIECGTVATRQIAVAIRHTGNYPNPQVFTAGQPVTITGSSNNPSVRIAVASPGTITIPANWASVPSNTRTEHLAATVVVTSDTPGSGSATLTLTATGPRSSGGSLSRDTQIEVGWTVLPCNTPQPTTTIVTCPDAVVYTGAPAEPCFAEVTGEGFTQSLPVSYSPNVEVGTVTASAAFEGLDQYLPSSASTTFEITPADAVCSVSGFAGEYDGLAHGATGTCTGIGGVDLSEGLDLGGSFTDVPGGVAEWTFTYPNYASQSGSAQIAIDPAASSISISCSTVVYDGTAQEPCTATVTGVGGLFAQLPVSYSHNVNAGLATASASYPGDQNHLPSEASTTFTIEKAASTVTLTCEAPVVYTGDPQTPCSATVSAVGLADFAIDVQYADNVNAGQATATAVWEGDANHTGSSAETQFTIERAPSVVTVTCPTDPIVFTGAAITPCTARVTGVGGLDEELPVSYIDNIAVGTATASAEYPGGANHLPSRGEATFEIAAWTLFGFYKPVDMVKNGVEVINVVKGGSTVPLKFAVSAGDSEITQTVDLRAQFGVKAVACEPGALASDDLDPLVTTGGTALRYDASAGQWIQNWQTPKTAGVCYRVTLKTADGSMLSALFRTK